MTDPTARRRSPDAAARGRAWRRAWDVPVWAHLLALSLALLMLVPVVGRPRSFLADEGAAIIQARSLESGNGWIVDHPLPEIDPDGAWYPVVNAERGDKGFAPLAKHPAYGVLTAAAARVGGVTGIVLLSLAGTVLAAGVAAALAGRFDRRLVRPAVWAVGLGSPMFFDGFLAMGHTLGAAFATAALLGAVVALQERRMGPALIVAPAVAGTVLLRNEALLFAAALTLVSVALAIRRPYRAPALVVAGSAMAAAIGVRLLERVWIADITGGAVAVTSVGVPASGDSFLSGRLDGFLATWVNPAYGGSVGLRATLLLMLPAIGWCASRVRVDPRDRAGILGGAAVAAALAVVALAIEPTNVVPGLLVAFPVATGGLLVLRRRLFDDVGLLVLGATAGLFTVAVLGTQYAEGGNAEWGGRYFALIVPAAAPLLLAALHAEGLALSALVRRGVATALLVCTLALSMMAIGGLRASNLAAAQMVARVQAAGRLTGDPRPVVLTTWVAGPRLLWPTFTDHRWLYVRRDDVGEAANRLHAAGIDRFLFVTLDLVEDRPQLAGFTVVAADGPGNGQGQQVLVVQSATDGRRNP